MILLAEPKLGWKRSRSGQVMTWHRGMKESTKRLASVGSCRLPVWGPKDSEHAWLNTLEDMASDRCQRRSCCSFLIDPCDGKSNPYCQLLSFFLITNQLPFFFLPNCPFYLIFKPWERNLL